MIFLALAITITEVALIVSLMVASGDNATYLARDTVFASNYADFKRNSWWVFDD